MNKTLRLMTLAAAMLALFSSVGCDKLRARDQLNKGVKAYKDNHYEQAIDHFQQSVRLDPTNAQALHDLADTLLQAREYDEAIEEFRALLTMAPSSADGHNSLGVALASKGLLREAAAEFQQAVTLQPGFAEAESNLRAATAALRPR